MKQFDARTLDGLDDGVMLTAALSTHFDPSKVLKADSLLADTRVELIDSLAGACEEVEVPGSDYRQWAMRPEARQHVLHTLAQNQTDLDALLDRIEVPADDAFARYLSDGLRGQDLSALIPPTDASAPADPAVDLDDLLKAVRFLQDVPEVSTGDLERKVRRRLAQAEAENALLAVVPTRLIGREREYAALLEYCSAELPTGGNWVPSFVLVGPGGIGKSALVSKFVSDRRHTDGAPPLIYLDFDRATLIDAKPLDLTFEFTRQLALADVSLDEPLTEFRRRIRSVNSDTAKGVSSSALYDLASVLSGWAHRLAPVTIVLDTFEEVAIRGYTAVQNVLRWVADLRSAGQLPQLHLVVCGREVLPDAHAVAQDAEALFNYWRNTMELEDLQPDDAIDMLIELGVEPVLAVRLPAVFGGNPFVLKLIHRFVTDNDASDVEQLIDDGRREGHGVPSGKVGQRFVYERILQRIKKPLVQALAYRGVVLRRVTPELIREVLAPNSPVRLDVQTDEDARRAFDELAEHVWIVTRVDADTVVHRADLRRLLVPGLENSDDVDTAAIHHAAAAYYAGRPESVPTDIAEIEEIYHSGFLDRIPSGMTSAQAADVVYRLNGDLAYWPLRTRARIKALSGLHNQLTEQEVASLDPDEQRRSRNARLGWSYASSDIDSAGFEEAKLNQLGAGEAGSTITDARWALLFDQGDFEFMTEPAYVLGAFDRYFTEIVPADGLTGGLTHEYPWYIAMAIRFADRGDRQLFSPTALDALGVGGDAARRYGAALAAVARDEHARTHLMTQVRTEMSSRVDLKTVDDIIVWQAAASRGDLDAVSSRFQTFSCDHFRLSHVAEIARAAQNDDLARTVAEKTRRYAQSRPDTRELNSFREELAGHPINLGGVHQLRAAPTTLSFMYGGIRTVLRAFDRAEFLDLATSLQQRSVFWPTDHTAGELGSTLRQTVTPTDVTALIETADRCGLIVDLVDVAAAKTRTRLSAQISSGIRQLESLLFPFATPRAGAPPDR